MTSRHQRALRVLCIAFCSIGWTTFSASAKSIPSSDGEVDPCTPTALSARQAEGELGKSTLQYEVATVGSCNRPKCGGIPHSSKSQRLPKIRESEASKSKSETPNWEGVNALLKFPIPLLRLMAFKPKLKETVECEGVVVGGIFACYNATDTAKPVDEGSSVSTNTVLFLTFGLLVIAIVCVAVSVAIYRKKKTVIAQQGKPGEKTLKAKRVVVIHAFDDSKLQEKCKELCLAIGAHLGDSKNVQDIYLTKDPSLLQDPQSWVTEKVMDTGTHFFGRQPHPRDLVLKTLLRHLATPKLKADYRRLFLVRFADLHDHRSGDLPNLVPGKRFVLPGHEGQLLEAIG
ncbi:hypothetical protein C7M84_008111 [Penaeus vannamei]|uniref:Uncharacterized protein n=1 Tax=Penaeus vannamei TaxID=6689 RepID=A0A423TAG5_PENVA|nr:hypothetical protein C7M84_008111 [Penaeus vannamei]